jgi:hypothetical protein
MYMEYEVLHRCGLQKKNERELSFNVEETH